MTRSGPKPRQPRLRLSCDGCFHAKVKCSRGPLCARCLSNGLECRYSVSSRAGKPKARTASTSTYDMGGWENGGDLEETGLGLGLGFFGMTESEMPGMFPWPPPEVDLSATELNSIAMSSPYMSPDEGRSPSMDPSAAAQYAAWADAAALEAEHVPTPSSLALSTPATAYLPSPSLTSDSRLGKSREIPAPSCACFADCLSSLHALHGASPPASPPFDVVLSLNRKAVQGCAAMLSCSACMGRPGTHTTAMLLATMIGKITTFYKHAGRAHFGSSGRTARPQASVSVGAYTLGEADGRWLELELLARELRRLEELHARFRAVCADLTDDAEVFRVVVGHLEHNLGIMLEDVNQQKGLTASLDSGAY